MNSFSIAFSNFKRNVKVYSLYIMSMIFSVLVYYNIVALKYNPDFQKANDTNLYIKGVSMSVTYLMLLLLLFFIWFSSSFFLKQRKKEIGIYVFMGVSKTQIAFIFAIEVLLIGITTVSAGLLLGILFHKLFLMMLAKVALLNMRIRFFISIDGIIETALTFIIIFFINSIVGYINIARSKLIDLFHATKREEQLPKINVIKGLLAIILIGFGYYFAKHAIGQDIVKNILLAICFVVIGTFWLFGAVYSMFMRYIISRKKILYNGVNIISFSNLAFRIKNNYRALAVVTVLIAITLTSYGTVASLKYYVAIRDSMQAPYSLSYISDDEAVQHEVRDKVKEKNKNILLEENVKFLMVKPHIESGISVHDEDTIAIKYSDFMKISNDLKASKGKQINPITSSEVVYLETPTVVMSLVDYKNAKMTLNNKNYVVKNSIKTPLFGNGLPYPCVIVNDEEYHTLQTDAKEYEFNGLKISNTDDIKAVVADLQTIDTIKDSLFANRDKDTSSYSLFGIIYFLGAFLALVTIIATGSIIHFKMVSEAYIDKEKFGILKKLGMTDKEAYKAISKQISVSYVLPLVVGIIHSSVAMSVLSQLMNYNIIVPAITSIVIFIVVYGIYFVATTRKYFKIVM